MYDPPVDVVGVGTHEIGVIAGSNGVGVFPSAKWMACRACADFFCGDYAILRCAGNTFHVNNIVIIIYVFYLWRF